LHKHMTGRCISTLAVVAVVVGLASCGSGSSGVIVAQVAGVGSISKAALEHWIPVEAVVLYQEYPTTPVPNGLIPVPPNYTTCIAYLEKLPRKPTEAGPKPTPAELKGRCAQRYRELKELTLNTLIGWDWTIAAGKTLGMTASDAEVRQRYAEVNKRYWPKVAEYKNYLKLTGQTDADMMLRYKVQVFEAKLLKELEAIEQSLPRGATEQQRQSALASLEKYVSGRQWVSSTSCLKGFVVSACKQYRGPLYPGIPN
jgi:hypothetical protein